MRATLMPERISILMPWPSRTLKDLSSLPSLSRMMLPSVRTPSTSRIRSFTRDAAAMISRVSPVIALLGRRTFRSSQDPLLQDVVDMDDTLRPAAFVGHHEGGDGASFHNRERLCRQFLRADGLGLPGHHFLSPHLEELLAPRADPPPQVPVSDNPEESLVSARHDRHAESLGGYLHDCPH